MVGVHTILIKKRPNADTYFAGILKEVQTRSTCLRSQDAALIVRGLQIISTGYNGAPSKLPHCAEVGCIRDRLGIKSGERHELCRGGHAESNAISLAAKHGISVNGATLYCTRYPCAHCATSIVNAGIIEVVYQRDYPSELTAELLSGIQVRQWQGEHDGIT